MRDIKLVALDLDGTLLDPDKRLSAENAEALARAAAAGVEIVPATGRFWRGAPQVVRDLPYVRYVIAINGAEVLDVKEQKTLCRAEIPRERAVEVMERLDTLPVIYDCYREGWGWMTRAFYDRAEAYAANEHSLWMIRNLRTPVPELKAHLRESPADVQKIQVFFRDMALRAEMLRALPEEFPDLTATKGEALRKLASSLGIPRAGTLAFGDDLTDIPMLRAAGTGVAMGNAEEAVKQAADLVAADCRDSGVARALEQLLWGNEP